MAVVKALVGLLTACVGTVGVALGGFAIHFLWLGVQEFESHLPHVMVQVHRTLDSLQQQSQATRDLLQGMREHVVMLRNAAEELADLSESRPGQPTLLENLEQDVHRHLEHTEEFIASMQATLRTLGGALALLESFPFFSPRMLPESADREPPLRAVSRALEDAADQLDQLSGLLARLRIDSTLGPRQLVQVQEILVRVDSKLQEVQAEIGGLGERLEQTGDQLDQLAAQAPRQVQLVALVLSVFFLCFGWSQLALLVVGFRPLFRSLANGSDDSARGSN